MLLDDVSTFQGNGCGRPLEVCAIPVWARNCPSFEPAKCSSRKAVPDSGWLGLFCRGADNKLVRLDRVPAASGVLLSGVSDAQIAKVLVFE